MFKNLSIQDILHSRTFNEFLSKNHSCSDIDKTLGINMSVLETKILNKRRDNDILEIKKYS